MISTPPSAAGSEVDALIEILIAKGILTPDEAAGIRSEVRSATAPAEEPAAPAEAEVARETGVPGSALGAYEPSVPLADEAFRARVNKFRIETADHKHRFGIRGRLMVDAAFVENPYDTTDAPAATGRSRGDLARHGTILRRARFGALGIMYDRWEWQMEMDFADNEVDFANAYIAYLFNHGRIAAGHFKEPFSLESSTSSRRISFIERAAPVDAYRPSRQLGLMAETLVPRWYAALGVFGGDGVARNREVTEGYSIAGRASVAPLLDEKRRLWSHLGVSANHRQNAHQNVRTAATGFGPRRAYEPVRMRTRLGTRAVDGRMIGEQDMLNVSDWTTYALEAAWGWGPFSLQGEYIRQDLNRDPSSLGFAGNQPEVKSMTSSGYYLQAGVFLTGETRNYRAFSGDFGQTKVLRPVGEGGIGAWEILGRYATADSTEHHDPLARQKLAHWTLGLNWYPVDDVAVKANIMYVDAERGVDHVNGGPKKWDSMVYALRVQYEF